MSNGKISSGLQQTLELGPVILFFAGFFLLRQDSYTVFGHVLPKFIFLTAIFVPLTVVSTALLWWLTGTLSRMQVFTVVLVVILGGISVWFNDPKFIKMKPTVLYLAFSGILFFGLSKGKSYLSSLIGSALPLTHAGWMILTRNFAIFFLALAIVNEIVWRTMSDGTWLSFKLFGVTGAMFVFFMAHYKVLENHAAPSKDDAP